MHVDNLSEDDDDDNDDDDFQPSDGIPVIFLLLKIYFISELLLLVHFHFRYFRESVSSKIFI